MNILYRHAMGKMFKIIFITHLPVENYAGFFRKTEDNKNLKKIKPQNQPHNMTHSNS